MHAAELFAAKTRTSAGRFRDTDDQIVDALAQALKPISNDPDGLARPLFAASQCVANHAERFEDTEVQIGHLCRLINTN